MKHVVVVGLGATGRAITSSLLRRKDITLAGAADPDPAKAGRDLGVVLGEPDIGIPVRESSSDLTAADLAIVATTSDLHQVAATVLPLLKRGFNVISICEELGHPWRSHPDVSRLLDETAKAHGVTVLGSGANPGVLMDTFPLLLSTLTQRVTTVRIRRRTDMSRYGAILPKFGLGLTVPEFEDAHVRGSVVGHHGFAQSIEALATGLGWRLDSIGVGAPVPGAVADTPRISAHTRIDPGQICAVTHAARGVMAERVVIDVEIMFALFEPTDEVSAGDEYLIVGEDHTIDLRSERGFDSFRSTVAAVVNAATAAVDADPGLLSMGDLPIRAIASKGHHLHG